MLLKNIDSQSESERCAGSGARGRHPHTGSPRDVCHRGGPRLRERSAESRGTGRAGIGGNTLVRAQQSESRALLHRPCFLLCSTRLLGEVQALCGLKTMSELDAVVLDEVVLHTLDNLLIRDQLPHFLLF